MTQGFELTDTERLTLEEMSLHHPQSDARKRARCIVLLASGLSIREVASQLMVSISSPYHWTDAWNAKGICGLSTSSGGSKQRFIPDSMIATAVQIAKAESLNLMQVIRRLQAIYNEPLPCSAPTFRIALRREGSCSKVTVQRERKWSLQKRMIRRELPVITFSEKPEDQPIIYWVSPSKVSDC